MFRFVVLVHFAVVCFLICGLLVFEKQEGVAFLGAFVFANLSFLGFDLWRQVELVQGGPGRIFRTPCGGTHHTRQMWPDVAEPCGFPKKTGAPLALWYPPLPPLPLPPA